MRSVARLVICFAATACLAAASQAQGSGNAAQAAAPEKPANPLEVKPPAPAEQKAYKAFQQFQAMPESDAAKKIQAGEDFIKKYAGSSYSMYVYAYLTVQYVQTGQIDKGLATGEQDLQANPSDFRTMGVLAQTIARTLSDSAPDATAKLSKAETLAKNAIAGAGTWLKPDSMSDENFTRLKGETLSMGHASLGLVAIHKNNFEAALPELEQAVQLGSNSDPTNYYLLGVANLNSGHFDKAVAAFGKCAEAKGTNLTATCVSLQDQAKKSAAQTQPK